MRRLGSFTAEVIGVGSDAGDEVILPNAVNNTSSRERIVRIRNPLS